MKRLTSSLCFLLVVLFWTCDDILEEDISDDLIVAIAPLDMAEIEGNSVQLRWESLEGADEYRLQILTDNQVVILDSLVENTLFDYQINPGEYAWRVRGENFAYESAYTSESTFSIVASLDLSNQIIVLESPEENIYLNDTGVNFTWQEISTANAYQFQLLEIDDDSNEVVVFEVENLINPLVEINSDIISEDGEYIWQVKGTNTTSETIFYRRNFFVDTQNPPAPMVSSPTANQEFINTDEVNFIWNYDDMGAAVTSVLEVALNDDFSTIVLTEDIIENEFSNIFDTAGTYYWRVKGEDAAGNMGDFSEINSFIIN